MSSTALEYTVPIRNRIARAGLRVAALLPPEYHGVYARDTELYASLQSG